ncbi:LytR C-terminal domain-containing protein [Microbacterium sp. H1-D42]|uniref:LytR C-terminal domain-containing protein n=1 Tax=Microbacterium sp. H1-D42 TaxID=2925844 RepID=UPI001F53CF0B|nr:LytR C-terminal domain-containing protein [Microbacterium sp. H1-D42]UNK71796.1 LytR C-terminal domain-containing protein [Microbacterium sp. H1-D42]
MSKPPQDRFDDIPRTSGRVGAHRAEQPGMNGLVVLLWSAAVALVLIVGGIFISLVMMDRISFSPESQPPAPQQTQGTDPKIDTSYRVLILNATPEEGLVVEARDALLAEGWPADGVFGSEGSSQEFDKTTVFYVDKADEAAALGVAEVLGGAEVQQSDFYADLNDSEQPQLTVVIGLDRVTDATPKAEDTEEAPAE